MKKRNLLQRFIIIAIVTIVGLYVVIGPHRRPHLSDFSLGGIKRSLSENIRLGLDLKGGAHLVMRVKVEEYLKTLAENNATTVLTAAKEVGANVKDSDVGFDVSGSTYHFFAKTEDGAKLNELKEAVAKKISEQEWSPAISGNTITWTLTGTAARTLSQQATEQAYNTIDRRINEFGVAEPTLQYHGAQGSNQILLQMPGEQDPERVKRQLTVASKLELVHVVSPPSPSPVQTYNTKEEALASLGGTVPANRQILPYTERDEPTTAGGDQSAEQKTPKPEKFVVIERPAIIEGKELNRADATQSQGANDFMINFSLKPAGAAKFGEWTGGNVNQYMGAVLDGKVKSVAFIKSQIFDSGQISGRFTKDSAEDLARTLRSGSLLAPIEYQEERTVGPSLGADSIRSGVTASLVGLGLVVAFMLFYYRGSGINAVVALLLNMILMMAALVAIKATLTLPGIAGIILTIGMAVDSNVLIFERIREEMRTGKTIPSAVEQGFARAFVTIIDTHVTTVVSSLFLFVFGTGPIKGFAVTLVLGLLVNLFSAVYVSRTIFIWHLNNKGRRVDSLSI
ncbi:MAG: preprotein translocase subunit SecD [Acidobacteriota bacterium]|jgi:preprotein translocase subunit SecD|nr:preprotein translocase subunit SecD [Acidobacteriota bacterium]